MATVTTRGDLFNQSQAARMLRTDRKSIRIAAQLLRLNFKIDPYRVGKLLDRTDVEAIGEVLGRQVDWDRLPS